MTESTNKNLLYYGDNLHVLRQYIKDETIDLIYLDPPFKSSRAYNILFAERNGTRSAAQIKAFDDTWQWNQESAQAYEEIVVAGGRVSQAMQAFRTFLGDNDMMAYLAMMAPRMVELKRTLKVTGSIYLHCDPTASHFLKMLMDAVFGPANFRNEIIWHYRKWSSGNRQFQRNHDVLFLYSRTNSKSRVFNKVDLMERTESTQRRFGKKKIVSGYDDDGIRRPSQMEDEESPGVPRDDVWDIGRVPPIKQLFPTQKPDQLLSRIIRASSNKGQVILDPFCGCGTTIVGAQHLKRRWIGIDITHLAIALIKHRLEDTFGEEINSTYDVIGEPVSLPDARVLANQNPYQFQWWALGLVGARPVEQKKGADRGIDGRIFFIEGGAAQETKQIILSVKSGRVGVSHVRDLRGVIEREKAAIGVLITLKKPTKNMRSEAASAGFYKSPGWEDNYPRIQILTVTDLLAGKNIDYPPRRGIPAGNVTFNKAIKTKGNPTNNIELPFDDHEGP